uniref:Sorting nexin-4 n=1 Tax=Cacopsylla melanoneura TaxID=428564 RepID=A0A8D9DZQ1_9HEMI
MGDGLQKAGHFFDSIAEFITPALEDEQLVADQMKEYWLYSSSLQAVYKQYELDQHALEVESAMFQSIDYIIGFLFINYVSQAVYKQYELDQHALEVHQQSLADKKYEKLKLEQGGQTNHFLLKIFGSIDSDDVREMKLQSLVNRVEALTEDTEEQTARVTELVTRVQQEQLRFDTTKAEDLRASLKSYVGLQIRMNRKCLNTWTNIKTCLESIP